MKWKKWQVKEYDNSLAQLVCPSHVDKHQNTPIWKRTRNVCTSLEASIFGYSRNTEAGAASKQKHKNKFEPNLRGWSKFSFDLCVWHKKCYRTILILPPSLYSFLLEPQPRPLMDSSAILPLFCTNDANASLTYSILYLYIRSSRIDEFYSAPFHVKRDVCIQWAMIKQTWIEQWKMQILPVFFARAFSLSSLLLCCVLFSPFLCQHRCVVLL